MKRPRQHQIGNIGELRVAHAFVQFGWIAEKLNSDYGFDFLLQRVEKESVTGDFALLQVKATDAPLSLGAQDRPVLSIAAKHHKLWAATPIPTFLVLVDLRDDCLFIASCRELAVTRHSEERDGRLQVRLSQFMPLTAESVNQIAAGVTEYWSKFRATMLISGVALGWIPAIGLLPRMEPILSFVNFHSKLVEILGKDLASNVTIDVMRSLVGRSALKLAAPNPTAPADQKAPLSGR